MSHYHNYKKYYDNSNNTNSYLFIGNEKNWDFLKERERKILIFIENEKKWVFQKPNSLPPILNV